MAISLTKPNDLTHQTYIRKYRTKYQATMELKYERCNGIVPPFDEKLQKMIDTGFIVETLKDGWARTTRMARRPNNMTLGTEKVVSHQNKESSSK